MARPSGASRDVLASRATEWSRSRWAPGARGARYREAGEGPPIVLVHGLGVSADYWVRNGPALAAAGHRVLAPDLPGFGRTAGPRGLPIPAQVASLRDWAEEVGVGPAVYAGHSLSCLVVLELAIASPEAVRGLVLAGPTGDPRRPRLARQALGLVVDVPRESWRTAVEVGRAWLQAGPVRIWRTWRASAAYDALRLAPHVPHPAAVVRGTRDPVVPADYARALAAALPRGRLAEIAGAAHAVIFSHAADFNRIVLEVARTGKRTAGPGGE